MHLRSGHENRKRGASGTNSGRNPKRCADGLRSRRTRAARKQRATCKALKSHLMRAKNVTGPKKGSRGQLATRDRIPRGRREAVERQATGGALFDKIEFDRSRSVRCPIPISVRRGEYPPRFRSTRCIMFARCRARRASTSLYPIASYGEIAVCIPLSLLQMGRVCYSERVQITFGREDRRRLGIASGL
jgi:hypothetical protein